MLEPVPIDAFAPQDAQFLSVSPKLATARTIGAAIGTLVPATVFLIAALASKFLWLLIGTAVCVGLFLWLLWLIPRQVRAVGYATAESDFMVRKGIMFRSLVVVPYGRIQYVDVNEGPIARKFGVASIQLHTASASTDASLDGLLAADAARLRDRLAQGGASGLSGI